MSDQEPRTPDATAGAYSPAELLELNESGGLSLDALATKDGRPKTTLWRIVTRERQRQDLERQQVAGVLAIAADAVAPEDEAEPAPTPEPEPLPDDELPLVITPGQTVGRKRANSLYLTGTSFGKPVVVVHVQEVQRAWRERGRGRLTLTPSTWDNPGFAILSPIRCNEATPEKEREKLERQVEAVLKMLDYLADVGVILPNPAERNIWPVTVTYPDGSQDVQWAVLFLKTSLDAQFLHEIVHGACMDMSRLSSERAIDRRFTPTDSVTIDGTREASPLAPTPPEAMQTGADA